MDGRGVLNNDQNQGKDDRQEKHQPYFLYNAYHLLYRQLWSVSPELTEILPPLRLNLPKTAVGKIPI